LLKNRSTQTIWRKEIPITRGYEYDLRDYRRVGLITRCETATQLRAAEIRKVEIGTDDRWHVAHRLRLPSLSICAGAKGEKRGAARGPSGAARCVGWIVVAW
jgi:hypothetical protein